MITAKPRLFSLFLALAILCFPSWSVASSYLTKSVIWSFADPSDFVISDSQKLLFSRGSVKLAPTGFVGDWAKIWHDESFSPDPGSTVARALEVDHSGYIYVGGITSDGAGGTEHGLILKLDQNLDSVWYKRDYFPGATKSEIFRMNFAGDGKLVVHGGYINDEGNCFSRLMKINPLNGSVIWHQDIAQPDGVIKISGWDRAAGPVFDAAGNIYIAHANNVGPGQEDAEPTGIYKFSASGNLIWQRSDSLVDHLGPSWAWEDIWDMVVDSEGSAYLSITVSELGVGLRWGLLKYSANGNFLWVKVKNWEIDKFQAPRGLAIDSNDYVYQNGNAGNDAGKGAGCGILKYDLNGSILHEEILTDIPLGNGTYCWSSAVDQFDQWVMAGQHFLDPSAYLRKHRTTNLGKVGLADHSFEGRFLHFTQHRAQPAFDRYGNSYGIFEFKDTEYSDKYSIAILKARNTYPDTTVESGDPLYLVNKVPFAFEDNLIGFLVVYGDSDQADVGFQISNDGDNWYVWSDGKWQTALAGQTNSASDINEHISKFFGQVGEGDFYFRAFMITDGDSQVDLASVTLEYLSSLDDSADAVYLTTGSIGKLPATGRNRDGIGRPGPTSLFYCLFLAMFGE